MRRRNARPIMVPRGWPAKGAGVRGATRPLPPWRRLRSGKQERRAAVACQREPASAEPVRNPDVHPKVQSALSRLLSSSRARSSTIQREERLGEREHDHRQDKQHGSREAASEWPPIRVSAHVVAQHAPAMTIARVRRRCFISRKTTSCAATTVSVFAAKARLSTPTVVPVGARGVRRQPGVKLAVADRDDQRAEQPHAHEHAIADDRAIRAAPRCAAAGLLRSARYAKHEEQRGLKKGRGAVDHVERDEGRRR